MPIVFSVMIIVFCFNSLIILNIAVSCPLPAEVSQQESCPGYRHTGEGRYPELTDNNGFPRIKQEVGSSSRFAEIYPANAGRINNKVAGTQLPA